MFETGRRGAPGAGNSPGISPVVVLEDLELAAVVEGPELAVVEHAAAGRDSSGRFLFFCAPSAVSQGTGDPMRQETFGLRTVQG